MTWVAVAVGGATLVSGILGSNAASSAARAQTNAANNANQLQWNMFQQQQANQQPWLQTGSAALGQLSYGLGLNGIGNFDYQQYIKDHMLNDPMNPQAPGGMITVNDAYKDFVNKFGGVNGPEASKYFGQSGPGFGALSHNFTMADYQADPGFQFRLDQGMKALERSGAARGMSLSGAQMRGVQDYAQGSASQEYGNAYNRFMNNRSQQFNQLASVAGLGQTANGQLGGMAMNTAGVMGNNMLGAGNAQAANAIAQGNTWSNAINTGLNTWQQYNMLNQMQNGGSGGALPAGYGQSVNG